MRKAMLATLMALVVSGTGMALTGPAGAQPAQRPALPLQGGVELTYEPPSMDGQGHVTWRWTAHNSDQNPVSDVVVTHRVTPSVPVTSSAPCTGTAEKITCEIGTLEGGQEFAGEVTAELPPGQEDSARIDGAATWTESPPAG
ncbi:hypothetical protein [Streptomyces sp. URMC 123]|uniref:hypothetical protein n=1 Tax=Streptomyces sp. URMC 123 TaxID=3423403 RepID=UPI003F1DA7EC